MPSTNPDIIHLRRLYIIEPLSGTITLEGNQHHYIRNVMRMDEGDKIRLFNAKDGEYLGIIDTVKKKETQLTITKQLRPQYQKKRKVTLITPILEKERMRWMIEKATELGITHYQPITTERSEIKKLNEEKTTAHMIEAAEQCERLDIPQILPILALNGLDYHDTIFAAIERMDRKKQIPASAEKTDIAIMIGPPGGFTGDEKEILTATKNIIPVDLGKNILRSETAALKMLSLCTSFFS